MKQKSIKKGLYLSRVKQRGGTWHTDIYEWCPQSHGHRFPLVKHMRSCQSSVSVISAAVMCLLLASWHRSAQSTCSQWGSSLAWFIHSFITFHVCLGSLSYWNIQDQIFRLIIWGFPGEFGDNPTSSLFHLLSLKAPGPLAAQQPDSMILPAPCLTAGMVFLELKASPSHLQTHCCSL